MQKQPKTHREDRATRVARMLERRRAAARRANRDGLTAFRGSRTQRRAAAVAESMGEI